MENRVTKENKESQGTLRKEKPTTEIFILFELNSIMGGSHGLHILNMTKFLGGGGIAKRVECELLF